MLAATARAVLFGPYRERDKENETGIRRERDEPLTGLIACKSEVKKDVPKAAGYATFGEMRRR